MDRLRSRHSAPSVPAHGDQLGPYVFGKMGCCHSNDVQPMKACLIAAVLVLLASACKSPGTIRIQYEPDLRSTNEAGPAGLDQGATALTTMPGESRSPLTSRTTR